MHAFEHHKIFIGLEIAGLSFIDQESIGFWVADGALIKVHFQQRCFKKFAVNVSFFFKAEVGQ